MKRLLSPIGALLAALVLFAAWCVDSLFRSVTAYMARTGLIAYAALPSNGAVTLLDFHKSIDPDGKVAKVIELLAQSNEMLGEMSFIEGNLPTGHQTTIRTGLPTPIWRQLYQGVPASKSTRATVVDAVGLLEARSEVDVEVLNLNGNSAAFRLSEAKAFIESMNQNMQETVIYGNSLTNPERFTGLAPRYSSLGAVNGANIIDAGGSGSDNTSMWLVVWGDDTVCGITPKGSEAGLKHEDLGIIDAFDSNNARFRAAAERFVWKAGITVKDWRFAVRIANIDVSDLQAATGTQLPSASTALIKLMIRAMQLVPGVGMGKAAFYCNRTVKGGLAQAALDKSSSVLTIQNAAQQFGNITPGWAANGLMTFMGVPVRTVDRIINAETRVV